MPGVGKSKIGMALATQLQCRFIDTDKVIIREYGQPLIEIVTALGDGFAAVEDRTLGAITPSDHLIISPGGSAIFCEAGMAHIASFATIVYLVDSVERIERRIPNLTTRGIVGLTDGGLRAVFAQRDPLYRHWATSVYVVPSGFPFHPSVKEVAARLAVFIQQ